MKNSKVLLYAAACCFSLLPVIAVPALAQTSQAPQLGKASVKAVVAAMTLEEKVNLVVGTGMNMPMLEAGTFGAPGASGANPVNTGAPPQAPAIGQTKALVDGAAGTTYGIERLGINPTVVSDGPAGIRISPTRQNDNNTYYCTAFPVATLLASSWNTELVGQVGRAMGQEALEYGIDIILGPGMNIQRNLLCGRNFEYYSEDPYLTGKMAAAMVKGVQSNGVGTSVKHFAANNAETNRNSLNVVASERTLREIYLEGFRIVVQEAQPWTVMSSYNLINDTYASENYDLLTKILRNDWGFKGYVMTDWFGGRNPVGQMNAGNDLLMPGMPNQAKAIMKAVQDGKLDVKVLDQNVERILNVVMKGPRFKGYQYSNKPDLKAHAQITRQAATEGMVLLKNDHGALPLADTIKNLAVFGNTSYDIITGGTGSGDVNEAYSVSLVEGLQNAGYTINRNLQTMYNAYLDAAREGRPKRRGFMMMMMGSEQIPELAVNEGLAGSMANVTDAAIITIGRNAGEGRDRSSGEGDFRLTPSEIDLIRNVTKAFAEKGKNTIVILNVGGVMETASWKEMPSAILLAWQAGQETGNSIADILCGKANPSGKLAVTFPGRYEDVPSAATFPGTELPSDKPDDNSSGGFMRSKPAVDVYTDGIYVGYRYYETFNVKPSYEFGYGLSYTTFEYSNMKLSSPVFKGKVTISVAVKNTGNVAGKEVAQAYLSAPVKDIDKPKIELKAFAKTRLLQPGESQTLTFTIDSRNLASFKTQQSSWIADAGRYEVKVGASSRDIRKTESFTLGKDLMVKKESVALVPKTEIREMKPSM
jgi:beta-glucosidase